jgi:FAD/FMN-containing dehydrogenase
MTPQSTRVAALCQSLPQLQWSSNPSEVKRKSLDFFWFSPVLRRQLETKLADAVVSPRNAEEIQAVVAGCVREQIPLTMRGAGTGNYGQAVPIDGGIVVDMTAYNQFLWARDGIARAQAGIKLEALNQSLAPHRWELRCMPSTYRMATLGGLFCGGFGGIGSITYGPLSSPGTVLGFKAMTVEAEPRIIELRSPEAMQLAHTYGTNGIILELELALAPVHDWEEYLLAFPDCESAFECGEAIAQASGLIKKETAVFADSVGKYFKKLSPYLRTGEHIAIVSISPSGRQALTRFVENAGGRVAYHQTSETVRSTQHTLLSAAVSANNFVPSRSRLAGKFSIIWNSFVMSTDA